MAEEALDEEDLRKLNFTQSLREKSLLALTEKSFVPDSTSEKVLMAQLLDGMDRTVLAKAKLKSDAKNEAGERQLKDFATEILLQASARRKIQNRTEEPVLPASTPKAELVPGELHIGASDISYEEIMGS